MRPGITRVAAVFLLVALATSVAAGLAATSTALHGSKVEGTGPGVGAGSSTGSGLVLIPAGTSFEVSSSYDCVAGHYAMDFTVQTESELTGTLSSGVVGLTLYVATLQQSGVTSEGHPSSWVYSEGVGNATSVSATLPQGSYVFWVEGADMNCNSSVVEPLEMLTKVVLASPLVLSDPSARGLLLTLQLNATVVTQGSTLGISFGDYNQLSSQLNLSSAVDWPAEGLAASPCGSIYPMGVAVYQGTYTGTNISDAKPLDVFPFLFCPSEPAPPDWYLFHPSSYVATLPLELGSQSMSATIGISGVYQQSYPFTLTPFPVGEYTVAAGDEWGNTAFAYFVVS